MDQEKIRQKETTILHPVVEIWLQENNYTYRHEVVIENGRVDYIAISEYNVHYVIECKITTKALLSSIRQVLQYCNTLNKSKTTHHPILAFPNNVLNDKERSLCHKHGVQVLELSIDDEIRRHKEKQDERFDTLKSIIQRLVEKGVKTPLSPIEEAQLIMALAFGEMDNAYLKKQYQDLIDSLEKKEIPGNE